MHIGTTYVYWEIDSALSDPGPYSFQLQYSNSGTANSPDWTNIGAPTSSFFTTDTVQRLKGKTATLFYRVIMTTGSNTYTSNPTNVLGVLPKKDWLFVREIQRKEDLNHRIFSSVPGMLLKARRYGITCTDCQDPITGTTINSDCTTCYGTGFVGGYYPAVSDYALVDPETAREFLDMKTGTVKPITIKARFQAYIPLDSRDIWVNTGSDERYYIHTVEEKAIWKSVPIVYSAELRLAPFSDIIYNIPLS